MRDLVPSESTERLIQHWRLSGARVDDTKRALGQAETTLRNAINNLGKHLSPTDAVVGEVFNVWCGSEILSVRRMAQNDYEISIRASVQQGGHIS